MSLTDPELRPVDAAPTAGGTVPADEARELFRCRLALLIAGFLWSLGGLFIKALTIQPEWHVSALSITFHRSLFAGLCLLPFARRRRMPAAREIAVAVFLYSGLLGLYVASTQGTTAANAIFLQYTAPLYALVLGPLLLREPVGRPDVVALLLAMTGIAVLIMGNMGNAGGAEAGPLAMGAGSGLMFGLFLLWLRRLRRSDPIALTSANNLGVAALVGCLLLLTAPSDLLTTVAALRGDPSAATPLLLLALMGCVQIALPYVLLSYGLRKVSSLEASLLALVEPVLNPVWVALIVREIPSAPTVAGGALIVAGLAARYLLFRPRLVREPG